MITIGSDPEFVILDSTRRKIDACKLFSPIRDKECNRNILKPCPSPCTKQNLYCHHIFGMAQIGSDCGFGELRPTKGNTPLEHRDNIEELIKVMQIPDNYKLYAGTHWSGNGLGGHIHFGVPYNTKERLSYYLSYYCGIPLKKIEIPNDLEYRGLSSGGYGYFGNYHSTSYGIEWRMPASWLVSREITTASLCLAYVVATQYKIDINHKNRLSHGEYKGLLFGDISTIITEIEQMDEYKYYYKEIEPVLQMIVNKEYWNPKIDFRESWL